MHKSKLLFAVGAWLLSLAVWAEAPPAPEPPPIPKDYRPAAPADDTPTVTATKRANGDLIEEYRIRGKLYMVKVTPAKGEPYYLIDQEGNQQFRRSDGLKDPITPPQWVLRRW